MIGSGAVITAFTGSAHAGQKKGFRWGERQDDRHRAFPDRGGINAVKRAAETLQHKMAAARRYFSTRLENIETNGDDERYHDARGSFCKTLPHDQKGMPDVRAYRGLVQALKWGEASALENVTLDQTVRSRVLANPQAAFAYPVTGPDGQASRMPPPPAFASLETAAEMLEVFWKAQLRDVPFTQFSSNALVGEALEDINRFPRVAGARQHRLNTLFRGETDGDRVGPYISQFLLKDVPYGNGTIEQTYGRPENGSDWMTSGHEWLTVQKGGVLGQTRVGRRQYIADARSLSEFVHLDFSYQAYLNAALILMSYGESALSPRLVGLSRTTGGFITLGGPDILGTVASVANQALSAAWFQKWLVHRRLRPEAYGGRLHHQLEAAQHYGLPDEMGSTRAIQRLLSAHATAFLPQAYPEGSPTHPSYPAGHACIAGACVTVLKAFFNEGFEIPNPVEANASGTSLQSVYDQVFVGGELNKLANNISLGRDWAGVHYRSDGVNGMNVGESVALNYLAEKSAAYADRFDGFELTTFAGRTARVHKGEIRIF